MGRVLLGLRVVPTQALIGYVEHGLRAINLPIQPSVLIWAVLGMTHSVARDILFRQNAQSVVTAANNVHVHGLLL